MNSHTLRRVVEQIANVTRYPEELLTVNADLADDLGIDSVKNLEIVLALGEEFSLDLAAESRDPAIRTIGQVAEWIDRLSVSQPAQPGLTQVSEQPAPPVSAASRPDATWHASQASLPAPHLPLEDALDKAHNTTASSPVRHPPPAPKASKPLAGRIAFITGSGHGVGRTIASLLAARGAHVIINSFHSRDQGDQTTADINAQGGQAMHLWGSVANPNHVERMFSQIEDHFGRLDILVCNASDGRIGSFMDLTAEDWDKAFRTNVSGHHQCAVRAAQLMRATGGSIITMSAVGAKRFIHGLGSQGVVKAAVESLTRYLACELGQFRIRVNCVVGGPVYGDLLSKFPAAEETQRHWESMTPNGELSSPMDLANAIGYLVSEEARGVNGAVWMVDQGFSAVADGRLSRSRALPTQNSVLV